ncbi:hypothetical protein RI129_004593 [Pyrocoelia pectoralis]|uniref:Uncharacterized protein n=1 Tax=Pyrocoelia pectoralis TaxID=417401 RepID=A0AAN7VLU1_9COLE
MKLLLVLCFLPHFMKCLELPQATIQIWNNIAKDNYQKCAEEFNIDLDLAENYLSYLHFPDEKQFQCFLRCQYNDANLLTSEGYFDHAMVVDQVHFLTHEIAEKCIQEAHQVTDYCERSYYAGTCSIAELLNIDRRDLAVRQN